MGAGDKVGGRGNEADQGEKADAGGGGEAGIHFAFGGGGEAGFFQDRDIAGQFVIGADEDGAVESALERLRLRGE